MEESEEDKKKRMDKVRENIKKYLGGKKKKTCFCPCHRGKKIIHAFPCC